VAEAVVFGHGRKYLTALDRDRRRHGIRLGARHDVRYTGFTSLASSADVAALIAAEIARCERRSWRGPSRSRFPHPAEGARSGRGRRAGDADAQGQAHLMYERFKALVEGMYDDREERLIAAQVAEAAP